MQDLKKAVQPERRIFVTEQACTFTEPFNAATGSTISCFHPFEQNSTADITRMTKPSYHALTSK